MALPSLSAFGCTIPAAAAVSPARYSKWCAFQSCAILDDLFVMVGGACRTVATRAHSFLCCTAREPPHPCSSRISVCVLEKLHYRGTCICDVHFKIAYKSASCMFQTYQNMCPICNLKACWCEQSSTGYVDHLQIPTCTISHNTYG
jgi:hypothetical protein